ncbi:hypothetical protein IWQ60_008848 [Tieghemiomyces parasiticus]|uniref:Alpha-ketoglutarate-dependent dioxygenase AlkB-like domain-containing protein n=1 Tax=Tieghemiomyces parasiticus TaxID=78921 RepID=A0A9W7ZR86_9FUNG|nr:hypothetical protein IWQ60_008848 [Tieghemiomyces parasiticus]
MTSLISALRNVQRGRSWRPTGLSQVMQGVFGDSTLLGSGLCGKRPYPRCHCRRLAAISFVPVNERGPADRDAYYDPSPAFTRSDYSLTDLDIIPDFVTTAEHNVLARAAHQKLRRYAADEYYAGHFDSVITQYRECTVSSWVPQPVPANDPAAPALAILQRAWDYFPSDTPWLPIHILDLHTSGAILKHVDNIEFSGRFVAGLCLLTPTVMRFTHKSDPACHVTVRLPPKCLYVQRDALRFDFTHEIPFNDGVHNTFRGEVVPRGRRISLLFRDAKTEGSG